jgi:exodeoxyribonuclease V alpha subunit
MDCDGVGHGFPLRDMIAAKIPCGELTEIRRNSGMIVESCKTIRESGTFISSTKADPSKPQENLIHVNSFAPEDQISKISSIISTLKNKPWGYDPVSDIQVLVPVNESSKLSRVNLNKILQDLVNPKSKANSCDGNPFRIGDKIINSKNGFFICDDEYNPEANENGQVFVANGEMAIVETVSATLTTARLTTRDSVVLKIPSGRKRKDEAAGSETETEGAIASWSLGYAITTHKSQGSEWPIAIVVIDGSGAAKMVCTREWVYTAFSRGKEYVAAVGPGQLVLEFCRKSQVWKRKTFLVELIRQISLNWDELKPDRITIPASSLCE